MAAAVEHKTNKVAVACGCRNSKVAVAVEYKNSKMAVAVVCKNYRVAGAVEGKAKWPWPLGVNVIVSRWP